MMIIDFGGGTLDVSIVDCFENIIEIVSIAGDNRLGGDDVDRAIVEYFCRENGLVEKQLPPSQKASLYRQAESAKIALSGASEGAEAVLPGASEGAKAALSGASEGVEAVLLGASESVKTALSGVREAVISIRHEEAVFSLVLTNELLRQLCEPVFYKVREVITRAMKDRDQRSRINDVILVGGSARLTVFVDFLEELFGRRPHVAAAPDEIVALGVGLCAGIKERAEDLQDLVMTDVCPFSLGVATYSYAGDRTPHMAVLISRSSMLPASHQERFYTLHNNQNSLRFEIYQGEGYFASENLKLGELEVQVPPGLAGEQSATVTFTYDIDGILHVSARSSGGDQREKLILNSNLRLTGEEKERALERIRQIQLAAQGSQKEQLLLERGQRIYEQTTGQRREIAAGLIGYWKRLMDQGDLIERQRNYEWIRERLDWLEAQTEADPLADGFWYDEPETDGEEDAEESAEEETDGI